jgi:hypothetical protein
MQALELSFPIQKGVSGSPILTAKEGGDYYICGIATGSVEIATVRHRSLAEIEEGKPLVEERIERVVEAGIAVRTSYYLDWQPELLEGPEARRSPHGGYQLALVA